MKSESKIHRPEIFQYIEHTRFIRDMMHYLRLTQKFTVRQFLERSGLKSTSYIRMIVEKQRKLTPDSIRRFTHGMFLNAREAEFFKKLVVFNQTENLEDKNQLYKEMLEYKELHSQKRQLLDQYHYFSHWYLSALFVALDSPWKRKSFDEMARSLGITEKELDQAFKVLERLGLAIQKSDRWEGTDKILETPPEMASLHIRNYHKQMILKGLEALENLPTSKRLVGGVTMALSERSFKDLQNRLNRFREQISVLYNDDRTADRVFQLSYQLFPLVQIDEEEAKD